MLIATVGLMLVIALVKYVTRKNQPPKSAQQKEMTTWSGLYRFSRAEIENAINYRNERNASAEEAQAGSTKASCQVDKL